MPRFYFEYDRKADLIYHLKRGPIIVPAVELYSIQDYFYAAGYKLHCTLLNGKVRIEAVR